MLQILKKYPTECMGLYFSLTFFILAVASFFINPIESVITIPLPLAVIVFICLLSGLIGIYLYAVWNEVHTWRKGAELFIMLAVICASLSDGFWIFSTVVAIIIVIGNIYEKKLSLKNPIFYLWGLIILISFISSFFAVESKSLSFGASFGLLVYALFFVAVYHQNFLKERGEDFLQKTGVLLSFSIISTVIFSLWHYHFPYYINVLIFQFQSGTGTDSFGMASIYGRWPTHSSAFLSLSFWALIGIYTTCSLSKMRKIILLNGIVFSSLGTVATLSRNALLFMTLSLGINFFILIVKTKQKRWWLMLGACGVSILGVVGYLVSNFPKWRELFTNPLQQATIADRINQYEFAIDQLKVIENPLLGIGLMNFGPYYRRILNNPNLADYLHQLFLSITLEIGYLGIITFLGLFFLIGKKIIINYKINSNNRIFVVVFFAWIATGIFDNWLYFMWSSTLFMILIALGSRKISEKTV